MSADTSVPKQGEAGLGELESWLPNAVLRDASAGMAFLDINLRFAWVNPALAGMYDRQAADFVGLSAAEVMVLTTKEIAAFSSAQIGALSTDQTAAFTTAQAASMSHAEHVAIFGS